MATAIPLSFDAADDLQRGIEKFRRREPLTATERAALIRRGMELVDMGETTDEMPEGGEEESELTQEEEEDLLMRDAVADAHPEDLIPAEKFFADRGIRWPPGPA